MSLRRSVSSVIHAQLFCDVCGDTMFVAINGREAALLACPCYRQPLGLEMIPTLAETIDKVW